MGRYGGLRPITMGRYVYRLPPITMGRYGVLWREGGSRSETGSAPVGKAP